MNDYTLVIIITFVAFVGLAALLLIPVYGFLQREEKVGKKWTDEHFDPWNALSEGSEHSEDSPNGAETDRDTP